MMGWVPIDFFANTLRAAEVIVLGGPVSLSPLQRSRGLPAAVGPLVDTGQRAAHQGGSAESVTQAVG